MSDEIFVEDGHENPPPREQASDPKYIKHVVCMGARFHDLHWDNSGIHCTEPDCIINAKPQP